MYKEDVTDILTGSSNAKSTALGARLKNVTPELFSGKTLNDEELVKATSKLQRIHVDAVKNGNDVLQTTYTNRRGKLSNLPVIPGRRL